MIPARDGVNLTDLHPVFVNRLNALHDLVPSLYVYSGVRSVAQQRVLYAKFLAGTGNLAANPDKVLGTRTMFGETFTAKGSWHMTQETGFGYAADIQPDGDIPFEWVPWHSSYVRGAAAPLGLTRTVQPRDPSKWEPWHLQPLGLVTTIYDTPHTEPIPEVTLPGTYIKDSTRYAYTANGDHWRVFPNTAVLQEHRNKLALDAPAAVPVTVALFDWLTKD